MTSEQERLAQINANKVVSVILTGGYVYSEDALGRREALKKAINNARKEVLGEQKKE